MSIQFRITEYYIFYCTLRNKSLISPISDTNEDTVQHKKKDTQDGIIIVNLHSSIDEPDRSDGEEQNDKD